MRALKKTITITSRDLNSRRKRQSTASSILSCHATYKYRWIVHTFNPCFCTVLLCSYEPSVLTIQAMCVCECSFCLAHFQRLKTDREVPEDFSDADMTRRMFHPNSRASREWSRCSSPEPTPSCACTASGAEGVRRLRRQRCPGCQRVRQQPSPPGGRPPRPRRTPARRRPRDTQELGRQKVPGGRGPSMTQETQPLHGPRPKRAQPLAGAWTNHST